MDTFKAAVARLTVAATDVRAAFADIAAPLLRHLGHCPHCAQWTTTATLCGDGNGLAAHVSLALAGLPSMAVVACLADPAFHTEHMGAFAFGLAQAAADRDTAA